MEIGIIIAGLTEVVKMAGMPSKYLPLFAVLMGGSIGVGAVLFTSGVNWHQIFDAGMAGVGVGLVTTGIVNRVDAIAQKAGGTY